MLSETEQGGKLWFLGLEDDKMAEELIKASVMQAGHAENAVHL